MATHPNPCPTCDRIREAHARGVTGRNDLAKVLGVALGTVTKHAGHAGITFDRAATASAVHARQVDCAAARVDIKQRLYLRAQANLTRLEQPQYSYRIVTGGEFATSEIVADSAPPAASEKDHAAAITQYLNAALKLEQVDQGSTLAAAHSLLDTLAAGLTAAAAGYQPPTV